MSHCDLIQCDIDPDLTDLRAAVEILGGEFKVGQTSYKWFGVSVGDYPIPAGISEKDLGKCLHAIKFPGINYEVGLIANPEKPGTLAPIWDFYDSKLKNHLGGEKAPKLIQAYTIARAQRLAEAKGEETELITDSQGNMHLYCVEKKHRLTKASAWKKVLAKARVTLGGRSA